MRRLITFLMLLSLSTTLFAQVKYIVDPVTKKRITYEVKNDTIFYSNGLIAVPSISSTDFKQAYLSAKPPVGVIPPSVPEGFTLVGTGSGNAMLGDLNNKRIKLKPGEYNYVNIPSAVNSIVDLTGVTIKGWSIVDIGKVNGLEIYGLSVIDHKYRPIIINELSNGLYLHHCNFKNVGDFCLSYRYTGIYDGTAATVSKDWRIENNAYQSAHLAFFQEATYTDAGITNLFRDFSFKNNSYKGPDASSVLELKAVDGYTVTGNIVDGVNMTFTEKYPDGEHNGVFKLWGHGVFSGNKITNHQGNAIRAWGFAFGDEGKTVTIDHNIVYNSWKYGAFEFNVPPEICEYRNKFPARIKPVNLKCFNNTAGKLSAPGKWDGQMIDLYNTQTYIGDWGSSIEYYNNLGFEMNGTKPVTDMINNMTDFKIIRNTGNIYKGTAAEAVQDIINFKSKFQGIGAQ